MPELMDICHGKDLGKEGGYYKQIKKYIYVECPECHHQRWVILRPTTKDGISRCQICCGREQYKKFNKKGILSPRWKGGISRVNGYIIRRIYEDDPFYCMAIKTRSGAGEVREHRYIMAGHLGRPLLRQEQVHHKNGIKDDNRIENLELISPDNHAMVTKYCKNCSLKKEIKQLKARINELESQLPSLI